MGSPKTGTTYLQSVFWRSVEGLAEQGLRLPLDGVDDHFFITLTLRNQLDPAMDSPRAHDVMDRLAAQLPTLTDDVLISHELLAPVARPQVQRLLGMLEEFEVHVVVTARDLQRQIPAEWQQHVKTRSVETYDAFLERVRDRSAAHFWRVQDVVDVAQRWGESLPPEQVHIVTVPPRGAPPGELLRRFCSVVDVDPESLETAAPSANASLGFEQAELLRRVNARLGDRLPHPRAGYNTHGKFWLAETILAAQSGTPLALPAAYQEWCTGVSQEQADGIRAAGWDVVGDLGDLTPPPDPNAPDRFESSDARLGEVAEEALAEILDRRHREHTRRSARRERQRQEQEAKERALPRRVARLPRRAAGKVRRTLRQRVGARKARRGV